MLKVVLGVGGRIILKYILKKSVAKESNRLFMFRIRGDCGFF
jgi:hypothetical protein